MVAYDTIDRSNNNYNNDKNNNNVFFFREGEIYDDIDHPGGEKSFTYT